MLIKYSKALELTQTYEIENQYSEAITEMPGLDNIGFPTLSDKQ
jgi:hypothetical protein